MFDEAPLGMALQLVSQGLERAAGGWGYGR
jgi:hypothetical protein